MNYFFKKNWIFFILLSIIFVSAIGFFLVGKSQDFEVSVENSMYSKNESLRLKIKNNFLNKEFCFSSCFPYFLEKKNDDWNEYSYAECPFPDRIEKCIKPRQLKAFIINLPQTEEGLHRLSIPACYNCNIGQVFHEDTRFFSDEFRIKSN